MFPPLAANKLPESLYIRKARVFWCVLSAAILQSGLVCYLPTQQSTVYWTMLAVVLSLLTSGWAVFGPATRLRGNPRLLLSALFMVCLTSLPSRSNLLVSFLGGNPPTWLTQALFGLVIVGISFVAWRGGPRTKTILLLLLGLVFVYRAQYAIRNVSEKQFDVVSFHHEGYRHFLNGVDPYAPPSPLYIDLETARKIYPPERLTANSILTGYPYPPLTFLLGLPFFTLLGDFRYAGVFALLLIAFLLHRVSPDSDGWLTAAITLTNPFGIQVVSFGWIETTLVMLLFLFLLCWRRWPAQSAWLFGLLISSKQTMVFWIPLGLVLLSTRFPRWKNRFVWLGKSVLAALLPILAFSLRWTPQTIFDSTVTFIALTPLRNDSLSIGTLLLYSFPGALWIVPLFGVGALCLILFLAIRKGLPLSLGTWTITYATGWTAFLILNRQAFPNYYFLAILLWLVGSALLGAPEQPETDTCTKPA